MYGATRYFTVTGHRLPDAPEVLADCTAALHALCDQLADGGQDSAAPDDEADNTAAGDGHATLPITDAMILDKARAAQQRRLHPPVGRRHGRLSIPVRSGPGAVQSVGVLDGTRSTAN